MNLPRCPWRHAQCREKSLHIHWHTWHCWFPSCYFMEKHEYETMTNICLARQALVVESTSLLTVRIWLNQVRTAVWMWLTTQLSDGHMRCSDDVSKSNILHNLRRECGKGWWRLVGNPDALNKCCDACEYQLRVRRKCAAHIGWGQPFSLEVPKLGDQQEFCNGYSVMWMFASWKLDGYRIVLIMCRDELWNQSQLLCSV